MATKLVESVGDIKKAVETHGWGTATIMTILGELMEAGQVAAYVQALPQDQRDDFGAEVWDQSLGNEPHALVHQVGFIGPEALEQLTDGMKAAFLSYFNARLTA